MGRKICLPPRQKTRHAFCGCLQPLSDRTESVLFQYMYIMHICQISYQEENRNCTLVILNHLNAITVAECYLATIQRREFFSFD